MGLLDVYLGHADALLAVSTNGHGGWIDDFGIVLAAAGVAVAVFHRLGFPVLFGYLLAGVLIGPHLMPSPLVEDAAAINQISELGVIFLLFFIGMEFDLRRLRRVLFPGFVALLLQTVFMLYLAQVISAFLGWSATSAVFFGSLLAISSSMVTVRVLRETGRLQAASAQFTIGILILEDILAVILLVILTGVAVTQTLDWDAAWLVTFLMGVFVVVVFVIGRSLMPLLFKALSGDKEEPEVVTLLSVGLVMGVSILALKLEFSPALGAFVAGTMLSQTQIAHRVETMNRSLHDVFSAVFFVSVGMQLEPMLLLNHLPVILVIALCVIGLKAFACWLGLLLAGESGRTAFLASVPKAQIGEFSFIIAGLGSSLEVMSRSQTGIAYGVALLTILFTPFGVGLSERAFPRLARLIPRRAVLLFEAYGKLLEGLRHGFDRSRLLKVVHRPLLQVILYFFLINGLIISASVAAKFVLPLSYDGGWEWAWATGYWFLVALAIAPFLLAVIRNFNALAYILTDVLFTNASSRPIYENRMHQLISTLILSFFMLLVGLTFLIVSAPYLPNTGVAGFGFLIALGLGFLMRGRLIRVNSQMELLFIESFKEEVANKEEARRQEILEMIQGQAPWHVEIEDLILPPHAGWSGKRIRDLNLRGTYGVTILALGRGYSVAYDPGPDAVVFSGDRLILTGPRQALERVRSAIQVQIEPSDRPRPEPSHFQLSQVYVTPGSALHGETFAGVRLRQRYGVTVIGVQRGGERVENPSPDFLVDAGDVLLIAGLPERIKAFQAVCEGKPLPAGGSAV
jgi:CPA2 family monovalent cation:H+ antiporter-2